MSMAKQKWMDRPWFAILSAASLLLGVLLTVLNVASWKVSHDRNDLELVKNLPDLRGYYLEFSSNAFHEKLEKSHELTNVPWVKTGVREQIIESIENFIAPSLEVLNDPFRPGTERLDLVSSELLALRLENRGGSIAKNCALEVILIDVPVGGKMMGWNQNAFYKGRSFAGVPKEVLDDIGIPPGSLSGDGMWPANGMPPKISETRSSLSLGDIESNSALIVPLYISAQLGQEIDPVRFAFGKVLFPKALSCANLLDKKVELELRTKFNTPLQLAPFLTGKG